MLQKYRILFLFLKLIHWHKRFHSEKASSRNRPTASTSEYQKKKNHKNAAQVMAAAYQRTSLFQAAVHVP